MLEFVNGAEGDLLEFLNESLLEETLALPKLLGNIKTGESRAFLSLVFESTSDSTDHGSTNIGRFVNELEVLSTSFSDETRVRKVVVHFRSDFLPEVLEDVS